MGNPESVIVTYMRGGGIRPPQDNEYLYVEETGAFVLWRSIGWATNPPTPVGRFAGQLDAEVTEALKKEIDAANIAGRLRQRTSPDTAVETIETRQSRADLSPNETPQNAWASLVSRLRGYLLDLTKFPEAALVLTVEGAGARLKHLGTQPLQIDLSETILHAALWNPSQQITLSEWSSGPVNLGGSITAQPGWSLDLPFRPDFKRQPGDAIKYTVTLTLIDRDQPVRAVLST